MNRNRGKGNDQETKKEVVIGAIDDPVHPVQFWANVKSQRWDPLLPEKKLWSEVLEDAFQCCVDGHVRGEGSRAIRQKEMDSAKAWFLSEKTGIGTFLWVCTMLNLDPKGILNRVTGLCEKRRMVGVTGSTCNAGRSSEVHMSSLHSAWNS